MSVRSPHSPQSSHSATGLLSESRTRRKVSKDGELAQELNRTTERFAIEKE